VWAAPGRSRTTLIEFFTALGPERCAGIQAISVDLHDGWMSAIRVHCPQAAICADPFHVIKLAGAALDEVRRGMWQDLRRTDPERASWIKGTRFAIGQRASNLRAGDRTILEELKVTNQELYAGWLLIEQLRGVYLAHDHHEATELLDDWILAALESGMEPFQRTALTLDRYRTEIANGGHELDRSAHQPPGTRVPQTRVPAVDADAHLRPDSSELTHLTRIPQQARQGAADWVMARRWVSWGVQQSGGRPATAAAGVPGVVRAVCRAARSGRGS